jgi:hypothetical protein
VGAGVCDRLRQLRYAVEDVNFGGRALDPERFRNRKAELFWNLRVMMEKGLCSIPADDELIADLCAIRFEFDLAGKIMIEPKEEARKNLGRSPDRADALALSLADGVGVAGIEPAFKPYTVPVASYSPEDAGGTDDWLFMVA